MQPQSSRKKIDDPQVQKNIDDAFDKEKLERIYRYPASYKEAMIHKLACKFGYSHPHLHDKEQVPVCPCCENLTSTMEIPLCYSTIPGVPELNNDVFLIDTDVSMYFTFIKVVIFYLLMRLLIFDAYTFLVSMNGGYCTQNKCDITWSGLNLKSIGDQNTLNTLDILNLAFTIASIIFFLVWSTKRYKIRQWLDFNQVSQDDFTILVENIPTFIYQDKDTKEDLSYDYQYYIDQYFERQIEVWLKEIYNIKQPLQAKNSLELDFWKFIWKKVKGQTGKFQDHQIGEIVTTVTLCFDITQIENMNKFRDQLIDEYLTKEQASKPATKTTLISHIPNQIDVINTEYINLCREIAIDDSASLYISLFTGKAFVTFQYQHFRDYCITKYQVDNQAFKMNGYPLKISKTNKPNDIYWYNMKVTDAQRRKLIFYCYMILLMMLTLSFAGLMGLQYWERIQNQNTQALLNAGVAQTTSQMIVGYVLTAAMAILTNIINFILSSSIQILSDAQKHKTKSDRLMSLIMKTIVTQTVNTSIIYSIIYLIYPDNPLSQFGLYGKLFSLISISGLISLAMQIFIPKVLIANFLNNRNYSPDKPINLFQFQLNKKLQHPEFNFAAMYSFYIIFSYVVAFYGFLIPIGTPVLIAIFFCQYWVDKYNLLRRFACNNPLGDDLYKTINRAFEINIFMSALGYFLWDQSIHYDASDFYRIVNIINLTVASVFIIVSIFLPYRIKRKIFQDEDSYEHLSYHHYLKKRTFKKTYFRQNPATGCLKESSIKKEARGQIVIEAADPKFIKEHQFDKFINLEDEKKYVDKYQKQQVNFYVNYDDDDHDYANDVSDIQSVGQPAHPRMPGQYGHHSHAQNQGAYKK